MMKMVVFIMEANEVIRERFFGLMNEQVVSWRNNFWATI
jgi:hypothetical protein